MRGFSHIPLSRSVAITAACLLLTAISWAEDEQIDVTKLPKPVADAVAARFPGAALTSAAKETSENQVIYDIELKHDGRKYEMDIKSDGTILEIEKEIPAKNLPAAVAAAVQVKYPNSTVKQVMEVNTVLDKKETLDHYEVDIDTSEHKLLELAASLDGKSIKEE